MREAKWGFRLVVLVAILVGLFALQQYRYNRMALFSFLHEPSSSTPMDEYMDAVDAKQNAYIRTRFPNEPFLLVNQPPDYYLALFKSHPERPWYLWQWWARNPVKKNFSTRAASELPLSQHPAETQELASRFAADVGMLHEMDPDNGYPLFLQAWLEMQEGSILTQKDKRSNPVASVVDPEHTAKAVLLVRQAAAAKLFTRYDREAGAEWLRALGEPRTYGESLIAYRLLSHQTLPNIFRLHDLALRLVAEAGRRAEAEKTGRAKAEGDATAYDILHDVQTLGARLVMGGTTIIGIMAGYSAIETVTEEGVAVLNAADQPEAAARLLARGRKLQRLFILARLMTDKNLDDLQPGAPLLKYNMLADDPELIAEAKRLLALRREFLAGKDGVRLDTDGDVQRAGWLIAISMPNIDRIAPWTSLFFTRGDLKASAHFELWGLQKFFIAYCARGIWFVLVVLLFFYAAHLFLFNKTAEAKWPTLRQTITAGIIFGVVATAPGFVAAMAGNFLWEATERHFVWQIFWNVWGVLAAVLALGFWIRGQTGDTPSGKIVRYGYPIALLGLLVAILYAYLVYSGHIGDVQWESTFFTYTPITNARDIGLFPLAFMLLPALVVIVCELLRRPRKPAKGAAQGASTTGMRLLVAGIAGGLLIWFVSYWLADWQERKWGERDTLIRPTLSTISFTPIEARLVDIHAQYMKKALAENP